MLTAGRDFAIAIFALLVLFAIPAFAETADTAAGFAVTVHGDGSPIPGAVVLLTSPEGDRTIRRRTDGNGSAVIDGLEPGNYSLRISYIGFADYRNDSLELKAGEKSELQVQLELTKFAGTVTISTPNRRIELLRDVAEPTTLLDAADIKDSGARTAKDILVEQSGSGVLVDAGGGQGNVSVNGISNKGVLILIDGRRWLGKNALGEVNLEDLDISQYERIEIVKGAGSALYGSDALGGVINFITRKPQSFGYSNHFDLQYGSFGEVKAGDTLGYRSRDFNGAFTASYRFTEGYDLDPDNPQTIGQPESKFYTVSGNGEYFANGAVTVRGFVDYTRRDIDNYFFAGATQLGTEVYNSKREITRMTVSPEADVIIGDMTLLNVRYNYSNYNREETQVYSDRTDNLLPWQEWNNELDLTVKHGWQLGGTESTLQAGYEFRNEKMDRANLIFPGTGDRESERDIHVAWAQNEFRLASNLKLTAGFRYDDYSDFGSEWSPKVSLMYAPEDSHRLRASYGHGFRAPSFGELYLDLGAFFRGNIDLEPEISDNFTIGYSYSGPYLQGSIDYFYNRIQNGISFDFSGFPFSPITFANLEEFTAEGVNTSLFLNLPFGFTASGAYTFTGGSSPTGDHLSEFPRHSGFFKLVWFSPAYGIRANIRAQFKDIVEFSDGTSQPAYQMWYLKADKRLFDAGEYSVSGFFQIDNLLDNQDIFLRSVNGEPIPGNFQVWLPPRTFLAGITVSFDSITY